MKNWPIATLNPNNLRKISSTWSAKGRSGSPPPMLEAGDSGSAKMPEENIVVTTQNDLLHGVGSQFATIDDSIKNKGIHPKL
ncbi:hypothetical protein N5P37_007101 [Trichoderma harzianum]|uniref:Uncharacterized protein n=1 Tax=Trichoderma harzianum CBS 226.95 TaxID=983964 RepID=A0A2T4AK62_TRIHA|nr:hypothetical protein M431DRAFT_2549 [Trichoderma harzianum CBS 226.95]KAK0760023.1 hypothetical protein N5P37_007101 [Trichoderma harzianum]PKK42783.1 hypothetical protein CI102_12256 [Trichoderma harzianum]PTB57422.1 hypothetical protein M431DRAFT_2549 [Trichoderma harzianum CBS 226.95]